LPGPDWEERITRDTNPAIRIEHDVRYRMAAPAIRTAPLWCDLGCGNGIAAASALGGGFDGRAVLVDIAEDALRQAEREVRAGAGTVPLRADLAAEPGLQRVREALLAEDGGGCITCFEVIEHLPNFVPLVELLVELAEHHGFTVALSVPNDAFWSIENPFHHTMWGEGAFEELRRLLPEGHVIARQFALNGSLALVDGQDGDRYPIEVKAPVGAAPTHFLVGIGPGASRLAGVAAVSEDDLVERRRWERQRESDLAHFKYLEDRVKSLEQELGEWRVYIHELEGRLGLPLSGTGGEDSA
jgi:2-polyprenyl-3-methyl-5-hydroxy-6-metoxy-1,4-benzoquinol methylase